MALGIFGEARLGPAATDRLLNMIYRGVVTAPPTSLFWSLGDGNTSLENPTEYAGSVRSERLCNRGEFGSTDSIGGFYQSSGTATSTVYLRRPLDVYVPAGVTETTTAPYLMAWLTASGGEPYFWVRTAFSNPLSNINQTFSSSISRVRRVYAGDYYRIEPTWGDIVARAIYSSQTSMPAYIYSMYVDYLFRGIDSFTQFFPLASYPNTYLSFGWQSSTLSILSYNTMPWIACPRNTATWSAPADFNTGVTKQRYITNLVTLTSGAATGASWSSASSSNGVYSMHIGNTVQSFDEAFYRWNEPTSGQLTWATGDQITFAPGQIQIVMI